MLGLDESQARRKPAPIVPGDRFGRLVTIEREAGSHAKHARWLCLCDCGEESRVTPSDLRRKRSRSCGCRARTPRPIADRFWAMVVRGAPGECWSWRGARHEFGYGLLGRGGRSEGIARGHRVSWEIHYGPVPAGLWVLHKCDNPICSNPEHLFLGTAADNHADMRAKGRMVPPPRLMGNRNPRRICPPMGELNGSAKLTDETVREIRRLYEPGVVRQADLAMRFGVSESAVSAVVRRARWRHVA